MFKHMLVLALFSSISISLTACGKSDHDEYNACIQKGIQYYKDIDSYPTLKVKIFLPKIKLKKLVRTVLLLLTRLIKN